MSNVRTEAGADLVRIGELARRSGVPPATLRAWERRYGVVEPVRGSSGYRLYSQADEGTVRTMRELVASGVAPAEAAERVLRADAGPEPAPRAPVGAEAREDLLAALLAFDGEGADDLLDRAFAAFTVDAVLDELVLPVLREIGDRWSTGDATVGQEHFASAFLRGRLLGLGRGWGAGSGRCALLACPSGEYHDIGLISFGLSLSRRGWRIAFLGPDIPGDSLAEAAEQIAPDVVVLYANDPERLEAVAPELGRVAEHSRLLLAGPGVRRELSDSLGAETLEAGPIEAAARIAA